MKLISEFREENLNMLVEANDKGAKTYYIEGIYAQANQKNRNGRIYERHILEGATGKYIKEQVEKGRAVGELNHPAGPTINLDKVSHRITELKWDGDNVIGKALILNTPQGKIVQNLMDGGVQLGVSTRGMGTLEQRNGVSYVKDDFHLATVDIVQDPSAPEAFVNGIMEGVEWIWNNGVIQPQVIEQIETEIKKAPRADLYETQVREFKNFLSLLKTR